MAQRSPSRSGPGLVLEPRTRREHRLVKRMVARGDAGQAEVLCGLRGITFARRYVFDSLYAVGGEGAVYLVRDQRDPTSQVLIGKIPLHPVHRPFDLTNTGIRSRRRAMRFEAILLETNECSYMPAPLGNYQFTNPLFDAACGDAFAEQEPVVVMEKLAGTDLDRWLARCHRSNVPHEKLRVALDRVAADLLHALTELRANGFYYADLRPGNMRMVGHPERHVRLLDAGGLVPVGDVTGRFPHVPAYLPPEVFEADHDSILASDQIMAVMAGRTLFEVATGNVPTPGRPVDLARLAKGLVCEDVAKVVAGLCDGTLPTVEAACEELDRPRYVPVRRVRPVTPARDAAGAVTEPLAVFAADSESVDVAEARGTSCPNVGSDVWVAADFLQDEGAGFDPGDSVLPGVGVSRPPWWRRLLHKLFGR